MCCTSSDSVILNSGDREEMLRSVAIKTGQSLIESIFSLPVEKSEYGPLVESSDKEIMKLPRKQHVPEPKPRPSGKSLQERRE